MALAISEHQATYWINRVPVATCIFQDGDLPSKHLYFGLTRYAQASYRYRRFDISRDPAVLSVFCDHVVTIHGAVEEGTFRMRCCSMSGEEVAVFDAAGATQLLPGTEALAVRDLRAHPCAEEGRRTIYNNTRQVKLRRGTYVRVRACFEDSGSVTLDANGSKAPIYLPAAEVSGLRAQGDERLGEFRVRLASSLGVLAHNLKLVLPDGRLLPDSSDAEVLQNLLAPTQDDTVGATSSAAASNQ
eukprot:gnl/TRDRNA2_/TRDRNA2_157376_c0_seq1.p1 gnl/TRDRNA2_/TRDRNA2_157376_c0~~gnl/TRDRNA2_/TRDRNA2_157376_c0_seq1.p1  ORF type:complete len:244 (-),score=44.53 gnl/TRDRNA2_/TRDRNA2_157376_c0_seq1:71-802(-)